ncbi:MAG: hypothetical protein DRR16_22585 [Candidatus Parabeggiatoa sp. nov. 3]|nr:MAG: hypothetical protein DRR16_22585 [Gammaproteobacteria bacterium]
MKHKLFTVLLGLLLVSPVYAAPPANDDLANALKIVLPYSHTQKTIDATTEASEVFPPCTFSEGSVWYQYTPKKDENVVFDTLGSDYDTVLAIWSGDEHPLTEIACNDNSLQTTQHSQINTTLQKNTRYFISVTGFNKETGTLNFNAKALESLDNDDLSGAIDIGGETFSYTQETTKASTELKEPPSKCGKDGNTTVWFQYTPRTESTMVLDTLGSNYDTVLSIWKGAKHPLAELTCNDDRDEETIQSQLSMTFRANSTYYIKINLLNKTEDAEQTDILVFNATPYEPDSTVPPDSTDTPEPTNPLDLIGAIGMGIDAEGNPIETTASFSGTITTETGLSGNDLTINLTDNIDIYVTVQVDNAHIDETADILMVVAIPINDKTVIYYMREGTAWEEWPGEIALLAAAEKTVTLPETLTRTLFQGNLNQLPATSYIFYMGYRLKNGHIIFNGPEPIRLKVQ